MKKISVLIIGVIFLIILCSFHAKNYDNSPAKIEACIPFAVPVSAKDYPVEQIEIVFLDIHEFDLETDYIEKMVEAAVIGNIELGREYERLHGLKLNYLGMEEIFTFDDLYLLSKIVDIEAGSSWITDEHKQLVASVVVNRTNSPEFPDTIYDVVYQKRQYSLVGTEYFENLIPSESSVRNALYVLENGSIAPKTVVFQAEFKQGSGIYKTYTPEKLGTTYFCYSSYPELYIND